MDLAGKEHWDSKWKGSAKKSLNPKRYINKRLIDLFSMYISKGDKVIEIGCANSQWLPFLKAFFDIEIAGIDYSEKGIDNLRAALDENNIKSDLYCCDFMKAPEGLLASCDVLISLGVIEHFDNYIEIIKHFSGFIKKGGIIITVIPNFASRLYGNLQKKISASIYKKHEIIDRELLYAAHKGSFDIIYCDYYGAFELALLDYSNYSGIKHFILDVLIGFASRVISPAGNLLGVGDNSKVYSNYIVCVGRKQ